MDQLSNLLGGKGEQPAQTGGNDIVGAFSGLLGGEDGVQGLVNQLSNNGLGEQVNSWVSTGPNQQVDPQQLQRALPPQALQQAEQKSGLDLGSLMPLVAAALPAIIDTLTPDGNVPQGQAGTAGQGFDLGGLLEGLGEAAQSGPDSPLGALTGLLGGNKG
jgi:uncharacterized protein YidB (DUF937 family)